MNFSKLSPREQVLALLVAVAMLLMLYGLLRFKPGLADLESMRKDSAAIQAKISSTKIPEPPAVSIEDMKKELETVSADITRLQSEVAGVQSRFAPFDSQELQIRLSEIARKSLVRIRDRKLYIQNPGVAGAKTNTNANSKAAREQRKAALKAAKQAAKTGKTASGKTEPKKMEPAPAALPLFDSIKNPLPGGLHDLPALLVADGAAKRPLQQLVIEGDFRGLQRFIAELEQLPWLVSVVKMDVAISGKEPPPGLPQPLTATLVISL